MRRYVCLLQCGHCRREWPHSVTYLGNVLASVGCTQCLTTFRTPVNILRRSYLRDFEIRVSRKPAKMLRRAKTNPVDFWLRYMPKGLMCKPAEIIREWAALAASQGC